MWAITALLLIYIGISRAQELTGNHPEWPRWCGKAYELEYPSFDPGGQTVAPPEIRRGKVVNLQFKPRYNLYLEGESEGEFIVNSESSPWHGKEWPRLKNPGDAPPIRFNITYASDQHILVMDEIPILSRDILFPFSLKGIKPRYEPYEVVLTAGGDEGRNSFSLRSEFSFLPRKPKGSVSRIDNINGTLQFSSNATNHIFKPFLPYGLFGACEGFLCERFESEEDDKLTVANISAIKRYHEYGLNSMIPLAPLSNVTKEYYDYMNSADLRYMYDLRGFYRNATDIEKHVSAIKDSESLYAYWAFDQLDGRQDPFHLPMQAGQLIRQLDPYHPIAVTLDCQNYYFKEYTAAADLIMEDVYYILKNSTYSKWDTPCNSTYGNCGCDNCVGSAIDVTRRLQNYRQYEEWENLWPKPKTHSIQAFQDKEYWRREPYDNEALVVNMLSFHEGARSVMSGHYPATERLVEFQGRFAKVITSDLIRPFLLNRRPTFIRIEDYPALEIAYWQIGNDTLLSVVNTEYRQFRGEEPILIPFPHCYNNWNLQKVVWGEAEWDVRRLSGVVKNCLDYDVKINQIKPLEVNMVILSTTCGRKGGKTCEGS